MFIGATSIARCLKIKTAIRTIDKIALDLLVRRSPYNVLVLVPVVAFVAVAVEQIRRY